MRSQDVKDGHESCGSGRRFQRPMRHFVECSISGSSSGPQALCSHKLLTLLNSAILNRHSWLTNGARYHNATNPVVFKPIRQRQRTPQVSLIPLWNALGKPFHTFVQWQDAWCHIWMSLGPIRIARHSENVAAKWLHCVGLVGLGAPGGAEWTVGGCEICGSSFVWRLFGRICPHASCCYLRTQLNWGPSLFSSVSSIMRLRQAHERPPVVTVVGHLGPGVGVRT